MAIKLSILNINTDTAIDDSCESILVDTSGNTVEITLPVNPIDGTYFNIKDKGNAVVNNITINGNGKNIDNNPSAIININLDYIRVVYCSTNDRWFII